MGNHARPWLQQAGLHASEATKPNHIQIARAEGTHGGGIVADRHVLDGHPKLLGELIGDEPVEPIQLFRVLVRNGTDAQHRFLRLCSSRSKTNGAELRPI